jgi:hypothetical protein
LVKIDSEKIPIIDHNVKKFLNASGAPISIFDEVIFTYFFIIFYGFQGNDF